MNNHWLRYGKPIASALRSVLSEVHAVRAGQDTPLPYCVYRRSGVDRLGDALDKDSGTDAYIVVYDVYIYTSKYSDGLDIVDKVLGALHHMPDLEVGLSDASEGVVEDGLQFVQSITINVR